MSQKDISCTAFMESHCIASGSLTDVVKQVKNALDKDHQSLIIIFDDVTSEIVEIDFRGSMEDVLARLKESSDINEPNIVTPEINQTSQRKTGHRKLGVVPKEVTLLPRHWEWLNSQPGGASVALRKLVEEARHANRDRDRLRKAKESVYRFMSAMAGNLPGYEDSLRALYADNPARFNEQIANWPDDLRNHTIKISKNAF